MLVLARRSGEAVLIGDTECRVKFVDDRGAKIQVCGKGRKFLTEGGVFTAYDFEIHVLEVQPGRCKIGVVAPSETLVLRKELTEMLWVAVRDGSPVMVFPRKIDALNFLEVPQADRKTFPVTDSLDENGKDYIIKTKEWSLY